MTANTLSRENATIEMNFLRLGSQYRVSTHDGWIVSGEYLGIEVAYDDWCIMLRTGHTTASLAVTALASVDPA